RAGRQPPDSVMALPALRFWRYCGSSVELGEACHAPDLDHRHRLPGRTARQGPHASPSSSSFTARRFGMGLLDMLNQVLGSGEAGAQQHFDQVAQNAPSDVLATGLASAFRSDQTPPIGDMVGTMFANSNGTQQAGMLNQIIAALGPAVAAGLAGGVLGRAMTPGSTQITPDQASQLSPKDVREVVDHA